MRPPQSRNESEPYGKILIEVNLKPLVPNIVILSLFGFAIGVFLLPFTVYFWNSFMPLFSSTVIGFTLGVVLSIAEGVKVVK